MGGRGAEVEEAASPFHILTLYNGTGRFTNPFYQLSEVTRDKQISGVSHFDSLTKPWQVDTPFLGLIYRRNRFLKDQGVGQGAPGVDLLLEGSVSGLFFGICDPSIPLCDVLGPPTDTGKVAWLQAMPMTSGEIGVGIGPDPPRGSNAPNWFMGKFTGKP